MSTEQTYEERVEAMEQEGMTTSDAQGVVDAEIMNAETPRTDAVALHEGNWDTKALRMMHHARELERELNAARKEAENLRDYHCNEYEPLPYLFPWEKK